VGLVEIQELAPKKMLPFEQLKSDASDIFWPVN